MLQLIRPAICLALLGFALNGEVVGQERGLLPPPPAQLLADSTRIVLQLPSSGGIAINHQQISWRTLEAQLRAIYSLRPRKVLLVDAAPTRTGAEIERIRKVAESQGIRVYAASVDQARH